nr:unnamed protein product [Callosobruchus analis]
MNNSSTVRCFCLGVVRKSTPKVVGINILTQKKVKTFDLCGLVGPASRLQYIVAEYAPDSRPFVYVSDAATRSILVFDVAGNKGYRVVLPSAVVGSKRRPIRRSYSKTNKQFPVDHLLVWCQVLPNQDRLLESRLRCRYEGRPEVYRWEVGTILKSAELVYQPPETTLPPKHSPMSPEGEFVSWRATSMIFLKNTVGCGASQRMHL